ncbi:hypothetical protein Godav_001139 [Gossypium davidsonii]|uniref:Uncharacterized protein n=1 Tax=Gossypium davidsonii TaxID=34287 RepID=A0A7J8T3L7_GOSDV|nr:hypothetical protein [Gossypium davidsonii]
MTNGLLLSLLVVSSLAMAAAVGRDDRVATALGKAKDKVSDTAHEANKLKQAASGTAHEAKEKLCKRAKMLKKGRKSPLIRPRRRRQQQKTRPRRWGLI